MVCLLKEIQTVLSFDRIFYQISKVISHNFSFSFTVLWFHTIFAAISYCLVKIENRLHQEAMKEIELFSIGIPHTRKSLVKGERFMRYEWRIWVCNIRFLFWHPPFKPYQKSLNNIQRWAGLVFRGPAGNGPCFEKSLGLQNVYI